MRDGAARPSSPERAFLIVVDDWERFDAAARTSLQALLTQLVTEAGAACIIATTDRRTVTGRTELPHRRLDPLDAAAARGLLSARDVDLPFRLVSRLLMLTAGNPLLLDVIGRAWAEDASAGPSPFRPHPRIPAAEERVLARTRSLSRECSDELLLVAVATAELPGAGPWVGEPGPVREAAEAGLLAPAGEGCVFRDPVVRAVVLSTAAPAALRAARVLVADRLGAPEHLRLLLGEPSGATPEERVDLLERAADERLRAGRAQEALVLLSEARGLAPTGTVRDGIAARTAVIAAFEGDAASLERALDDGAALGEPSRLLDAARHVDALMRRGDVRESRRAVVAALAEAPPDSASADLLLAALHFACVLRGDALWWQEALDLGAERRLDPVLRLVEACVAPTAPDEWERRMRLAEESAASGDPWKKVALHLAWSLLEVSDERSARLAGALDAAEREGGLPATLALTRRAVAALHRGRLDEAAADLDSAALSARELPTVTALIEATRALLHAVRGDDAGTRRSAERATSWALQHGAPTIARAADQARSSLDLARGRFEEAHARFSARPSTATIGLGPGYGPLELLDAAEAASRLRLIEHAAALREAADDLAGAVTTPRQRMLVTAATAVLDTTEGACAVFEQALGLASDEFPLERSRVHLCYGEWLRRRMRPLEARAQFRLAAAGFTALGAELWHTRAQQELRAAGGGPTTPSPPPRGPSSASRSAGSSLSLRRVLSNKQIANRLFVSPRTVSGHLYRVFPKLGVTSRAGLRDALLALQRDQRAEQ
ncbi:helix-turn-helix transcriptional regulator [Rathayibacter oskolensis]|uniref:helix-turn-helix domain-containing protein n=1 Tax=Rathayibacter oskolensis TaxID=1891671 RepID=UPI00265FFD2B|nr:helix-turn-helix transcriptional regulator [Rathayibacter oskolensis]WKK72307.1 helix-turn-helix transcriptional regulator [Rathayibacter oskolensis]